MKIYFALMLILLAALFLCLIAYFIGGIIGGALCVLAGFLLNWWVRILLANIDYLLEE